MRGEAGGRFDTAGSPDGQEERRFIESGEDAIEVERGFSKPADVRANFASAGAERKFAWGFVELYVFERQAGAGVAAALEEFAVHVNYALGTSLLMEIVDVLRAQEQATGEGILESSESEMGGIGLCGGGCAAAHGVKVPYQARVAAPGVGRGDLFEAVVAPQPSGIAKRGDPTFGAYTGAGKNENTIGGRNGKLAHKG